MMMIMMMKQNILFVRLCKNPLFLSLPKLDALLPLEPVVGAQSFSQIVEQTGQIAEQTRQFVTKLVRL